MIQREKFTITSAFGGWLLTCCRGNSQYRGAGLSLAAAKIATIAKAYTILTSDSLAAAFCRTHGSGSRKPQI